MTATRVSERLLVLVLATVLVAGAVACNGSNPAATDDATPAATASPAATPAEAGAENADASDFDPEATIRRIWWNQETYVDELGLDRGQRRRMDAHLGAYLERWPAMVRARREGFESLRQAMASDDAAAARRVAAAVGEAAAYFQGGMLELKVDVLEELSAEQRRTLIEQHLQLVRRPWVMPQRLGRGRRARR